MNLFHLNSLKTGNGVKFNMWANIKINYTNSINMRVNALSKSTFSVC